MSKFTHSHRNFVRQNIKSPSTFDFDIKTFASIEPVLSFFYNNWFKVNFTDLEHIKADKPCLIVGNTSSIIPWPAFMLSYAVMQKLGLRVNIAYDLDSFEDERICTFLREIGFVPFSNDNLKKLFKNNEIVVVFPEAKQAVNKPTSLQNRLYNFDWTCILPAIENNIDIYPLTTVGIDESCPTYLNLTSLAKFLEIPSFPVTPFFPWLPFPLNFMPLPGRWQMKIGRRLDYSDKPTGDKNQIQETAKWGSLMLEGDIQAEINRILRNQ